MAPRQATAQRRNQSSQNEGQIFELGVRGRKTGVTLVDTGERDEYGMEPVDNLFSSPEKETGTAKRTNGASNDQYDGESDEEQSMELDDESQLGPATVARMRNPSQGRLSIPRARSPVKTHLNSPARHNTHIAPGSSPARGSVVDDRAESPASKSVKRRLNFANPTLQPPTNGNSKAKSAGSQSGRPVNRLPSSDDEEDLPRQAPLKKNQLPVQQEIDDEEEEEEEDEEPMEVLDMGDDNSDVEPPAHDEPEMEDESGQQEDEEEEPAAEISIEAEKPQPKKRGRKPKNKEADSSLVDAPTAAEPAEAPAKKQRGRPKRDSGGKAPEPATKGSKRRIPDEDHQDASETANADERGNKKARQEKGKAVKAEMPIPKPKAKPGRKRKSSGVGPASPAVIPRAPMPKSRGLQILRREGLGEGNIRTTRSGRISAKPLEFWKGERYEFDTDNEDLVPDKGGRHIKLATIKSVVRVEAGPDEPKAKRRGRPGTGVRRRPTRQASVEEDEDEDRSDWEDDPGRMAGECIVWRPEYEQEPPEGEEQVEVMDEELAISEAAVQMKDIKGATFQFAKTLTLPFFGSGIVDLPPHSEKKPKNARKMQMVFFVHYGSVEVTIAGTQFRIGKGGQFFVPRGNHYSISNNSERPARIFFAQGCEMLVAPEGEEAAE